MTAPVVTLVLLPGMDGSGALFADFIAALGDGIAPLVLCYPAHQALDYQALTGFVRERLPAGQPFVLLGESFSGPVAIAVAAARPANLLGLVLTCTFARNPVPLLRRCSGLLPFIPFSSRLTGLALPLLLGSHGTTRLYGALRNALDHLPAAVLRLRMREVLGVDYSSHMRSIVVPVLYLQAAQDRIVSSASARHIASLLPLVQVSVLRGPHLLLQAAPVAAASLVREFVGDIAALARARRT